MPSADATDDMGDMEGMSAGDVSFAVQPESSGDPFADAKKAAAHVTMAAATLAGGIDAAADLDALDENSVALADAVGSIAGDDNRTAFLDLRRQHIGFFVDYAVATAGDDAEGAQAAQDSLTGYAQDAGAFFEQITGGELPADGATPAGLFTPRGGSVTHPMTGDVVSATHIGVTVEPAGGSPQPTTDPILVLEL